MSETLKFKVYRSRWLRGEGTVPSRLLREEDGKRCCLGELASACGVSDADILGIEAPAEVLDPDTRKKMPADLFDYQGGVRSWSRPSSLATDLMCINDDTVKTDRNREHDLTRLFKKAGIEVEFTDEEPPK